MSSPSKHNQEINIIEFIKYLLSNWLIYAVLIVIFSSYFAIRTAYEPYSYESSITAVINDPNQKTSVDLSMSGLKTGRQTVSLVQEELRIRSLPTIERAIRNIKAHIEYKYTDGFRNIELYKSAPFEVIESDTIDNHCSFSVEKGDNSFVYIHTGNHKKIKVNYGENFDVNGRKFNILPRPEVPIWKVNKIDVIVNSYSSLKYAYQNKVEFRPDQRSMSVIYLSTISDNKQKATDYLYSLVREYNNDFIITSNQVAINTSKFITERLSIIGSQLDHVEGSIDSFLMSNKGMDYKNATIDYLKELNDRNKEEIELRTQIQLLNYTEAYIKNPSNRNNYIPLNIGVENTELTNLINSYNQIKSQISSLLDPLTGGGLSNPVILELEKNLSMIEVNITSTIKSIKIGLEYQISNIKNISNSIDHDISSFPQKGREFISLERQQKIRENIYTTLLSKLEDNAMNQAIQVDRMIIVDTGNGSNSPVSPNKTKAVLMGVIVGLILGTLYAILKLLLDTKVRSLSDVEAIIDAPFLGEIPLASNNTPIELLQNDHVSESFRALRSQLLLMKRPKCDVIVLNSFGESSGKTYISSNLARALAFGGKRVLIMDLDIRKGTISKYHNVFKNDGITNYIVDDDANINDYILPVEGVDNLKIIPSGPIPPNPSELLMDKKLDRLVNELENEFDFIIMDNVPIDAVADPFIVNRLATRTLFVIRAGKLEKKALSVLNKIKNEGKLVNIAMVLNGIDPSKSGYGYGYSYSYGYGNYGSETKNKGIFSIIKRFFKRK